MVSTRIALNITKTIVPHFLHRLRGAMVVVLDKEISVEASDTGSVATSLQIEKVMGNV